MSYLLRNRTKKTYLTRVLAVVVIFVGGAILFSMSNGVIMAVAKPIWKSQNVVSRGINNSIVWFQSKDDLVRENTYLKEELRSREIELVSLRASRDREEHLLEMLGRANNPSAVLASVLARPPETLHDVLLVDAGSKLGIEVGDLVSLPEGSPIGHVVEVWSKTSKVLLYSASGEKTNAILESNNLPVIMQGRGGGNFLLALQRDMAIEAGDRILSADVRSELMAVVGSVKLGPTDSFKEVIATMPANLFTLRYVIITPQ
jgi:cell shape-determining protein MreC